jgi:hypothetical protein
VPSAKPDIGIYERQITDEALFYRGFNRLRGALRVLLLRIRTIQAIV